MEKKAKKTVKKVTKKKVVKKVVKRKYTKRTAEKVAKRINTAFKKVSKKQAERLSPEEVIILEDSGMSLKVYNVFARRNGIVPIKEHDATPAEDVPDTEGKTINLKGTAKIVTKMTDYGRDMQNKHQILEDARRIQPLPDDMRQDSKASCACPICTLKLEYKHWYDMPCPQAAAAIRRMAKNVWVRVSNRIGDFFMWFEEYK